MSRFPCPPNAQYPRLKPKTQVRLTPDSISGCHKRHAPTKAHLHIACQIIAIDPATLRPRQVPPSPRARPGPRSSSMLGVRSPRGPTRRIGSRWRAACTGLCDGPLSSVVPVFVTPKFVRDVLPKMQRRIETTDALKIP